MLVSAARKLTKSHTYIIFHIFFHYGFLQDIEDSSLCYTVGYTTSYILVVYSSFIYYFAPTNSKLPPSPDPATTVCSLCL